MNKKISIYYGSLSFFMAILHNIFLLYHVDVCLSFYKIDKFSFWLSELIFLIWNSCNDPIFGWVSDRKYLRNQTNQHQMVNDRLSALQLNGPLWALVFTLFWFKWCSPFIQFVICLCAYDGFLTVVDLQYSALLADLTTSHKERAQLNKYCSLFSALGSLSVFMSYSVWNVDFLFSFQVFCFIIASISFCGFYVCNGILKELLVKEGIFTTKPNLQTLQSNKNLGDTRILRNLLLQFKSNRNFMYFVIMNLVQVFHCHFNSNFFPLIITTLLSKETPTVICSSLIGLSFVAPHLNNIYLLSLSEKHGVYKVINFLFFLKLLLALVMFFVGRHCLWFLGLFIVSNRIFTEGACKLLNLVVTDLVDEDFIINHRSQPIAAVIFGGVNFLSKPGQTFAPIITTLLLSYFTGQDVFKTRTQPSSHHKRQNFNHYDFEDHKEGIFNLLIIVPIVCSLIQLVVWRMFTLHDARLQHIKAIRNNVQHSLHV